MEIVLEQKGYMCALEQGSLNNFVNKKLVASQPITVLWLCLTMGGMPLSRNHGFSYRCNSMLGDYK
jgi:hypothetical protein